MHRLLRIASVLCILTAVTLILNLVDILDLPSIAVRLCGAGCMISLFLMVYSRVWLIRYTRKRKNNNGV